MIRTIAIDDEPLALKVIEHFCRRVDFIELLQTFTKPNEALRYLETNEADLLFLDINMPSLSGIDLYKSMNRSTMVIFTTAYSEYAVDGFNLNATDYLVKPFTYERFMQAVEKAKKMYEFAQQAPPPEPGYMLVRADYSLVRIDFSDILYIESLDDYLKIHLPGRKPVVARMTMKYVLEQLPASSFVRIHRSFIVPLKRISAVRNKTVLLDTQELPIGNSYEESFFAAFKKGA